MTAPPLRKADDVLLLRGNEIVELLRGRELEIVDAVRRAYLTHEQGDVSAPNCAFLRFPNNEVDRIIPKPAYLGGDFQTAGLKWIASFPGNLAKGVERASATLIVNSVATGEPVAILESSVISAYRTAASAALGATVLRGPQPLERVGVVGCGLINFETLRFLLALRPEIGAIELFDVDASRAAQYARKLGEIAGRRTVEIRGQREPLLAAADVVSVATTAITPHIDGLEGFRDDAVILHVSLRDFTPRAVLAADNIVDDVDHVCSNRTSLDLTAQARGNRDFIRTTLGAVLCAKEPARAGGRPAMFSPFGLGILDLAVAHLACGRARGERIGTTISHFLPTPWTARTY